MLTHDEEFETLKAYLDGARAGEFWIASTAKGRGRLEREAIPLSRILQFALIGCAACGSGLHPRVKEAFEAMGPHPWVGPSRPHPAVPA